MGPNPTGRAFHGAEPQTVVRAGPFRSPKLPIMEAQAASTPPEGGLAAGGAGTRHGSCAPTAWDPAARQLMSVEGGAAVRHFACRAVQHSWNLVTRTPPGVWTYRSPGRRSAQSSIAITGHTCFVILISTASEVSGVERKQTLQPTLTDTSAAATARRIRASRP